MEPLEVNISNIYNLKNSSDFIGRETHGITSRAHDICKTPQELKRFWKYWNNWYMQFLSSPFIHSICRNISDKLPNITSSCFAPNMTTNSRKNSSLLLLSSGFKNFCLCLVVSAEVFLFLSPVLSEEILSSVFVFNFASLLSDFSISLFCVLPSRAARCFIVVFVSSSPISEAQFR